MAIIFGEVRTILAGGALFAAKQQRSVTCFASEAARSAPDRATAVVRGATPLGGLGTKPPVGLGGEALRKICRILC